MPPKKTSTKRARSPIDVDREAAEAAAIPTTTGPITWPHTLSNTNQWQRENSLLFLDLYATNDFIKAAEGSKKATKVAAFDMDDTLVMSKSGKVFAQGRHDWKYLHAAVPSKLQQLHQDGYRIVIFTNQSGIGGKGWDEGKANDIRGKITDIGNALAIPLSAWVSTTEDTFRKPGLGMWEHFCSKLPFPVDLASSFYCGDAAGRTIMTLASRKKDFSCSDRKFAINAKLPFFTPEEYFAGLKPLPKDEEETAIHWDGVSPSELKLMPTSYPLSAYHKPGVLECVILVGYPGSGKSTFFRRFFAPHNYVHVNRDTLKDIPRCVKACGDALAAGKSVVIDNTSPTAADRKPFIDLANKFNASVRAIHMAASKEMSNHMNVLRDRVGISPRVSSIAFNIFKSRFEAPDAAKEGYVEVISVPPVADFTDLPPSVQAQFFMLT